MIRVMLTDDEARKIRESLQDFELCDSSGNILATVNRELTPEFIAELKRRAAAPGPRYSMEQSREMLRTLQEAWDREGPFGTEQANQIVEKLRANWAP